MVSNIIYRLSLFADYTQLAYNKQDMISILNAFDNTMIPVLFQETMGDGSTNQRMQFSTPDQTEVIKLGADRIDIQLASNTKEGFNGDHLEEIKEKLFYYYTKIHEVFHERVQMAYRLAWFTSFVFFDIGDQERQAFRDRFIKQIDFFNQNRLEDTIVRYGAQRDADISNNMERINVIMTISRYKATFGIDNEADGYLIDYDINTWQGNRTNRFGIEAVKEFEIGALSIQNDLNKEIIP